MKFLEKYPNMIPIFDERNGIIKGSKELSCHNCKQLTDFIEINYEGPFCSEECLETFENTLK